eukprot:ANDGO_02493.mRNA.1 NmrA-like family domain-containing protein DDB_G0286605
MSKRVVVFGSTGIQGGSVVRALASLPGFSVVGVTRNADSEKSKALAAELSGNSAFAGLVEADLDKPESLLAAVKGAWGVFAVTNWWEIFDTAREVKQGKAVVDACREQNVQFVIFSGLPCATDYDPSSTLYIDHLDGKREIEKYLLGDANKSIPYRTATRIACYMQNWLSFFVPRSWDGGKTYALTLPMEDKYLQVADTNAYGPFVAQVFAHPGRFNNQIATCTSDVIKAADIAAAMTEALGVTVVYNAMPHDEFAKLGFPHADELARMFKFFCKYWQAEAQDNLKLTRELVPQAKTFPTWIKENAPAIRSAMGI